MVIPVLIIAVAVGFVLLWWSAGTLARAEARRQAALDDLIRAARGE